MEAQNASKADSDDEYLDDVVIRSVVERLQREFADDNDISVYCNRFDYDRKDDHVDVLMGGTVNGHRLARITQQAIDTGVVELSKIEEDRVRFYPSEN